MKGMIKTIKTNPIQQRNNIERPLGLVPVPESESVVFSTIDPYVYPDVDSVIDPDLGPDVDSVIDPDSVIDLDIDSAIDLDIDSGIDLDIDSEIDLDIYPDILFILNNKVVLRYRIRILY